MRVRHVFVDEDALDERGIRERAADFAVNFDQVEEDVFPREVGYGEDGVDGDLGEMFMILRDTSGTVSFKVSGQTREAGLHFATKTCHRRLE